MTIRLQLDKASTIPLYQQIYRQLRPLILNGTLPPSKRLPATRRLAAEHQVARVTVLQAYEQLEAEGFVEGRPGAGTYVVDNLPVSRGGQNGRLRSSQSYQPKFSNWGTRVAGSSAIERPKATRPDIDFGFGRAFPHIFPYDVWRRILGRYLSTDDVMLARYGSVAGFAPLRQAVADYLMRLRGVNCSPDQVVIVS
ncbi:MAG: GntR family transcriptional regulator, partial [Chloroflexota bacterium]